ncbi:MAG: xylulokinase [Kutzneria sp.]|nr:xylulokinase [Kutzneria sp.]MBV9844358.1 xylulokinase [Kutzneria sp.]
MSRLVAGVDSSTQSCKVVVREADSGRLVRSGRAPHPDGTEVHPDEWWHALDAAVRNAGGLADVAAVSVAAQQHGMVCLDDQGQVVRPALLWNDLRSAAAAADLVTEAGAGEVGRRFWADAVGSVPLASFTVAKARWLATHEPDSTARTAAIALPHDWLTWRLGGRGDLSVLVTDRSDASGTGYWSPATGEYRADLLRSALGRDVVLPKVLAPSAVAGTMPSGARLGPGAGDNAASALGVGAARGDIVISLGTSGTVFAVAGSPVCDSSGVVAGFADATGMYLPLVCTLNAVRVLSATARLLGVDLDELSRLALSAPPGSEGLVVVPYLEGERTPSKPDATGAVHGLTLNNSTPANLARAAVEGMLCGLADGLDALIRQDVPVERILLVGGGARAEAVRRIAPTMFGGTVLVPRPGEYTADGAARQAAWVLQGGAAPPDWPVTGTEVFHADPRPEVRDRYAEARDQVLSRVDGSSA